MAVTARRAEYWAALAVMTLCCSLLACGGEAASATRGGAQLIGRTVSFDAPVQGQGRPFVLLVLSGEDCLSCANYALEVKIIQNQFPLLPIVVAAVGEEQRAVREYFARYGLSAIVADAPADALLRRLQVHTPLALLLDDAGRILFADARQPAQAAGMPLARALTSIRQALGGHDAAASDQKRN